MQTRYDKVDVFSERMNMMQTPVSFASDYTTGAHPKVLEALIRTNNEPLTGYGTDKYTSSAADKIKKACGRDDLDVFLLTGGTQTNALVISTLLRPFEGVISAVSGHIGNHEAGAIEYTGHKVLPLPHHEGKICPQELSGYMEAFYADENREHMVFPGMVYISHPTEYGTLYTKDELSSLSEICRKYHIPLYLDGARLGYGLMSSSSDMTLSDIADLCDAFYIGGTKMGALCGEAVVFRNTVTPLRFMTQVKQHGAMVAKGRLSGVQFDALFTDELYFEIGKHAIRMAEKLKALFAEKGYPFFIDSPTNQQFIILENEEMERLKPHVTFSFWEPADESHTVVRFATSWSTTEEDICRLSEILEGCK